MIFYFPQEPSQHLAKGMMWYLEMLRASLRTKEKINETESRTVIFWHVVRHSGNRATRCQ